MIILFIISVLLLLGAAYLFRKANQRKKDLVQAINGIICTVDPGGVVREVINKKEANSAVIDPSTLDNIDIQSLLTTGRERTKLRKEIKEVADGVTEEAGGLYDITMPDHTTSKVWINVTPCDGGLAFLTIQKANNIRSQQDPRTYIEEVLNHLDTPSYVTEPTVVGGWMFWNNALCQLLKVNKDDIHTLYTTVLGEKSRKALDDDKRRLLEGGSPRVITLEAKRRGDNARLLLRATQRLAQYGETKLIVGTIVNITEQEKHNAQMKLVAQQLSILKDDRRLRLWKYEPQKDLVTVVYDNYFGLNVEYKNYTRDEIVNMACEHDRARVSNDVDEIIKGYTGTLNVSFVLGNASSTLSAYEISGRVAERNEQGTPTLILGTCIDVSRMKEFEKDLVDARKNTTQQDAENQKLLNNIAYVISVPLDSIVAYSQLLEHEDDAKRRKVYVEAMQKDSKALLDRVSVMVQMESIKSGKATLIRQPLDLNGFLVESAGVVAQKVNSEKVSVKTSLPTNSVTLMMDTRYLQKLMDNLTSNAIKFTDEGTITIGYERANAKEVRVFVKDTGRGISEEQLPTLFTNFENSNQHLSNNTNNGLSLAMCKAIVERFGGKIGVESKLGEGSEFWFTLPIGY